MLVVVALVAVVVVVVATTQLGGGRRVPTTNQAALGTVLLVPGYGGTTAELQPLAAKIRAAGRSAVIVDVPDGGTGDLTVAADAVARAAEQAIAAGAPSVDVIGYSAGGVIARIFASRKGSEIRRVITIGSPHHGTKVAALAATFAPGECAAACLQLVPGSKLLAGLEQTPGGPRWISLWSTGDQVVTPPTSARLKGALDIVLQDVCPGIDVSHGDLPTTPLVLGIVLQELGTDAPSAPRDCRALTAAGS